MEHLTTENLQKIKRKCGIYKITIKNHTYIGSSNNIANRLRNHRNTLIKCKHHNHTMQNCFNKYGLESILFEVIEECPEDILLEREAYYIQTICPDINHILDPTRPKFDKDTIKLAVETRKRNNLLFNRRPANIKKVYQYDIDGNFIKEWKTLSDAANFYNCNISSLSACCRNKAKTAKGFQWSYIKENRTKIVRKHRGITVIQYDCNMNPIMVWPSFKEIYKKLSITPVTIKEMAKTKSFYKGSYWEISPNILNKFENISLEDNPSLKYEKFVNNNPKTSKTIYQYNMQGEYIGQYGSVHEAGRCLNVSPNSIAKCARNKYTYCKSAYGYRWSYNKVDKLSEYTNNSSKAVNKKVILFNCLTGEELIFDSIADAVRQLKPNITKFDSECATLSSASNRAYYYDKIYLAKNSLEVPYIIPYKNIIVYNKQTNTVYKNIKEASTTCNISTCDLKNACSIEQNEWFYMNQCARVKLRESGKLFEERQP